MIFSLYARRSGFLLIATICYCLSVNGQSKDQFEKIFLKETQGSSQTGYGRFTNVERLSFYPDTLPGWFFSPPSPSMAYAYGIGISDPDMKPEEALEQAMHRAKAMAVLCNRTQIQYFRDIYTVEFNEGRNKGMRQRYDTYFKLSGTSFADSTCFEVVAQHTTRYNEAMVLIKFTPLAEAKADPGINLISTVGTALYIEAQIGGAFEPQAEYELITKFTTPVGLASAGNFIYREKGNRFLAISEYKGQGVEYPMYNYKYANPAWAPNTQPLISYNGLWSAFAKRLLMQLTLETEQSSVNIRSLDEKYSPEMRNLSREVAIKTAKMNISGIEFGVDSIGFKIDLTELK